MERLILFDIDGTLTRTRNGHVPFNRAIAETFGVAGDIRMVLPDGMTDPRILEDIFTLAGMKTAIAGAQLIQFAGNLMRAYEAALCERATSIRALSGVPELLKRLSEHGKFGQGIVTGNFECTARIKLRAAGLAAHLGFGGYASDSSHRPDLPAIARQRWEQATGRFISPADCVIVGDTPKDLEAARANGMKCVLVGTGRYCLDALRDCGPDACVADLTQTAEITELLLRV